MKATIKTLSPVHIGNGTTYNRNIDYFQAGDKIGILDEEKLLSIIGAENIHQWVAAIDNGGNAVVDLLKSRGWTEDELEKISKRICTLAAPDNKSTQLKEQYRTAIAGVCIPGSSLKGAIRTAIFNHLADDEFLKTLNINDLKNNKGSYNADNLEKRLFGNNANEKSTRFIKIRDVHFGDLKTKVFEMKILNAYTDGWFFKDGEQMLVEAIPSGAEAISDMVFDERLMQLNLSKHPNLWPEKKTSYLAKGIPNFCKIINSFTRRQIKTDLDDLEEEQLEDGSEILGKYQRILNISRQCTENEFVVRVGGHSGYLFTTGRWVDDENLAISNEDFFDLRENIQKRDYSDMALWPKTRKVTSGGQIFGFIKFSIGAE